MSVVEVRELRKAYGPIVAVDGISFSVAENEIFGLVGPNGAGKTTTIECLEGLRTWEAGEVSVLGLDPGAAGTDLRRRIGVQLAGIQPVRPDQGAGSPGPVCLLLPAAH